MRVSWWPLPPVLLTVLLLTLAGSTACSTFSADDAPLPDTTFTQVLIGLHLSEARNAHVGAIPSGLRDSVLARHGVSRRDFETTLHYYSRHPDAFEGLYDTVLDSLNALESDLRQRESYPNVPDLQDRRSQSPSQ